MTQASGGTANDVDGLIEECWAMQNAAVAAIFSSKGEWERRSRTLHGLILGLIDDDGEFKPQANGSVRTKIKRRLNKAR